MIRTTLGLIAVFALIAAACVAFGAYFSFITLQNAHRQAVESRFAITAERIAQTAQFSAGLGIALPAQETLGAMLPREQRLDSAITTIDVADRKGQVLFSSDPSRLNLLTQQPLHHAISRPIDTDLGIVIGHVIVHYDTVILAAGDAALSARLRAIALPTLGAAALATILIGLLLAAALRRSARRAADPALWPPGGRSA